MNHLTKNTIIKIMIIHASTCVKNAVIASLKTTHKITKIMIPMIGGTILQGTDAKLPPDELLCVAGLFAGALGVDLVGELRTGLIAVSLFEPLLFSGLLENPVGLS